MEDFTRIKDIKWIDKKSGFNRHGVCVKHWVRWWYDDEVILKVKDKRNGTIHKMKLSEVAGFQR